MEIDTSVVGRQQRHERIICCLGRCCQLFIQVTTVERMTDLCSDIIILYIICVCSALGLAVLVTFLYIGPRWCKVTQYIYLLKYCTQVQLYRGYARDIIIISGSHTGTPTEWPKTTLWTLQCININRKVLPDCIIRR